MNNETELVKKILIMSGSQQSIESVIEIMESAMKETTNDLSSLTFQLSADIKDSFVFIPPLIEHGAYRKFEKRDKRKNFKLK